MFMCGDWLKARSFLFLVLFLTGVPTFGAEKDWKVVSKRQGTVSSQYKGENSWTKIISSRLLKNGDKAKTEAESLALIHLADESIFKMGPNSLIEMSQFQLKESYRLVDLKLLYGRVLAQVAKKEKSVKSDFKISSPTAVMAARGSVIGMDVVDAQGSSVCKCYFGSAEVTSAGVTRVLVTGQTALALPGVPPLVIPGDGVIMIRVGGPPAVAKGGETKGPSDSTIYADPWKPKDYDSAIKVDSQGVLNVAPTGTVSASTAAPPPANGSAATTAAAAPAGTPTGAGPTFTPVLLNPNYVTSGGMTVELK